MEKCLVKDYGEEYLNKYVKELGDDILNYPPSSSNAFDIFLNKLRKLKDDNYFKQDLDNIQKCIDKNNTKPIPLYGIIFISIFGLFILLLLSFLMYFLYLTGQKKIIRT